MSTSRATEKSAPGAEPESYSVSALMVYERCPLQYYHTYVMGVPPPVSRAMRMGTDIHAVIAEHLLRPQLFPPVLEPAVQGMLDAFVRSRFNHPPLMCEEPVLISFRRGRVSGRIDLVLPRPGGGVEIVDFKSGAGHDRPTMQRSLQLPLYALGVSQRLGLAPEDLSLTYFFLRDGAEVSVETGQDLLDDTRNRVDRVLQQIGARQFAPSPGCRCYACRRRVSASPPARRGRVAKL